MDLMFLKSFKGQDPPGPLVLLLWEEERALQFSESLFSKLSLPILLRIPILNTVYPIVLKKERSSKSPILLCTINKVFYESEVLVIQLWPTLCSPKDCSPPGFSVHGILQARILEWVAIPFSSGSFQPRSKTWVSHTAGRFLTIWATREAQSIL